MSQPNGNGAPPPHEPAAQVQEVKIVKEVSYASQATAAERTPDGARISFVVFDGGQPIWHRYTIGAEGKKAILEELSGGLTLP